MFFNGDTSTSLENAASHTFLSASVRLMRLFGPSTPKDPTAPAHWCFF
jgi:hypothetical protein